MNGNQREKIVSRFVDRWDGIRLTRNGNLGPNPNGAQCVNVANQWCAHLDIEPFYGNADTFWTDPSPDCQKIANVPGNAPHRGDIVVFDPTPDGLIGPAGHVDVCIWATLSDFLGLDQNYPDGTAIHQQSHIYDGVVGWLRPKCLI